MVLHKSDINNLTTSIANFFFIYYFLRSQSKVCGAIEALDGVCDICNTNFLHVA